MVPGGSCIPGTISDPEKWRSLPERVPVALLYNRGMQLVLMPSADRRVSPVHRLTRPKSGHWTMDNVRWCAGVAPGVTMPTWLPPVTRGVNTNCYYMVSFSAPLLDEGHGRHLIERHGILRPFLGGGCVRTQGWSTCGGVHRAMFGWLAMQLFGRCNCFALCHLLLLVL